MLTLNGSHWTQLLDYGLFIPVANQIVFPLLVPNKNRFFSIFLIAAYIFRKKVLAIQPISTK
jgi:hypothetical protein